MNDIIEFLSTVNWPGAAIVIIALIVAGYMLRITR